MNKRYQVFVSSTYLDLREARLQVIQALLELDCIPSGMELFSAADEEQWTYIRKVIDECDYYVVIVAGRYGSTDDSGMSFTEKEYRYALKNGKPILAFLHGDLGKIPSEHSEKEEAKCDRLEQFRELVEKKLCKYWSTPEELSGIVSRGIVRIIASQPGIGWVRGDAVASTEATSEILDLRKQLEKEKALTDAATNLPPAGTEDLAQGDEQVEINVECTITAEVVRERTNDDGVVISTSAGPETRASVVTVRRTWNELFAHLAPDMLVSRTQMDMENSFSNFIRRFAVARAKQKQRSRPKPWRDGDLQVGAPTAEAFTSVCVQFAALGMIENTGRLTLTPYGNKVLTKVRAIRSKFRQATPRTPAS